MNATAPASSAPPVTKAKGVDPLAAARAARKPRDPNLAPLTDRQKVVLGQVRLAAKSCKLLAAELANGKDISSAAAVACSTLAAEYMASGQSPAK